jgi:tetratricopeptide (TPR) repeat protein
MLVLWQAARLVFHAEPLDDIRRADALFTAGRYHDARAAYKTIVARWPRFAPAVVRLGAVYAVRGEHAAADETLAHAVGMGLGQADYQLARLYQGWLAAQAGQRDTAVQYWSLIAEDSPWFPLRRLLEAENLLALGDYAGAEAAYRAALVHSLPHDWRALATTRLALLRASSDPAAALAELDPSDRPSEQTLPAQLQLALPLLPTSDFDARQLADALAAPAEQRAQLLGQLYLQARLYGLAEAQFTTVAATTPIALSAAAYAAYTRWSAGDRSEGLLRLRKLVADHPSEPRPRALLALLYLFARDESGAQAQLAAIRALAPRAPDTHLAWAQWYAAQHDYVTAADEYRRALGDALPDQRGIYALALARFHLETSMRLCQDGLPAAEEAARALPDDRRVWTTLAATRFGCGDAVGARSAAEQALERSPTSAEASYYLGRALAMLGDRPAARLALVNAADLAPASQWRERAEAQISTLGL